LMLLLLAELATAYQPASVQGPKTSGSAGYWQFDAPNVWQLQVPLSALARAHSIFEEALMPRLVDGLIADIDTQPLPCAALDTKCGQFFAMRAGSSTNHILRDSSDLAWISVNDEATFKTYANIFAEMGVAEAFAPLIDCEESVRLYSCFYVVRSRCGSPNLHTDWPSAVGTNAFTLLTPLEVLRLVHTTWNEAIFFHI